MSSSRRGSVSLFGVQKPLQTRRKSTVTSRNANHLTQQLSFMISNSAAHKIKLTAAEIKLCKENGVYPEDAVYFKAKAVGEGCNIEIRGGTLLLMSKAEQEFAPKPITIKAKTKKTPGFTRGLSSVRESTGQLKSDDVFAEVYPIPLARILASKGEYELVHEKTNFHSGRLVFKATSPEAEKNIFYSINLDDKRKIHKPSEWAKYVSQPDWWSHLDGRFLFNEAIEYRYPAQYQKTGDQNFHDDLVYAVKGVSGKTIIIGSDNDLYAISVPVAKLDKLPQSLLLERVDTFEEGGTQEMIKRRIALDQAVNRKAISKTMAYEIAMARELVNDEKISRMGNLTPYESAVIADINRAIEKDYTRQPIQHGPETGNLHYTQPVTKTLIFTAEGMLHLLETEQELVNWRRRPEVIATQFYPINENGKMSLWRDFVADQLVLKQPVSESAKLAFMRHVAEYYEQEKQAELSPVVQKMYGLLKDERDSVTPKK